jgi:hypothetical protein
MMSRALLAIASLVAVAGVATAIQVSGAQNGGVPSSALALLPSRQINDTLHVKTNVASFKVLPKGDKMPAGRLEFGFEGTVLITGMEPGSFLKTTGNIRKEYQEPKSGKQVYFGKGRILLVGKFSNCQWFGRNLDLTFQGDAIVRMIAEFDSKLNTGEFWFDPNEKVALQPNLMNIAVPSERGGPAPAITREEYEAQKKKLRGGG